MNEPLLLSPIRERYEKTKNPLYVWKAIRFLEGNDEPLPAWIREYLLSTAKEILSLDSEGKQYYQKLANAIGVKSRDVTNQKTVSRNIDIFLFIEKIKDDFNGIDECYSEAAKEFKLEKTGIGKIYREIARIEDNNLE